MRNETINIDDMHARKYMRLAKQVGEDNNPCYSRHIGVVIMDPVTGKVIATGYNGPPRKVPHNDDREYLEDVVWPQLTEHEKKLAVLASVPKCTPPVPPEVYEGVEPCEMFCNAWQGKKTCPRKLVGAPSGQRLELCSCAHAETNAIVNASCNLYGGWMFAYCGVPCYECTKLICQAHIRRIYCLKWENDYSFASRWMLRKKGVEVIEHPDEWYMVQE